MDLMRTDIKASCTKRLNRIEGQVRGLSRMVEEDRYCIDIVTQVAAIRAALRRVEEEILRDHVGHCVEHAIRLEIKLISAARSKNLWPLSAVRTVEAVEGRIHGLRACRPCS